MIADESRLKHLFIKGLSGDETAYGDFYSNLTPVLRAYVRRHLHSTESVEDVLQETLLAIHTKRHTHDPAVPITAWIHAIARYKIVDFLRSAGRSGPLISLDENPHVIEDASAPNEGFFVLRKLVELLPARLRVPIELTKIEGLSVKEAAEKIGISQAAIKVNVHRGLKAIAHMLGERS